MPWQCGRSEKAVSIGKSGSRAVRLLVAYTVNMRRFMFPCPLTVSTTPVYSHKLKPEIPLTGEDDIPLKHEIEFGMIL